MLNPGKTLHSEPTSRTPTKLQLKVSKALQKLYQEIPNYQQGNLSSHQRYKSESQWHQHHQKTLKLKTDNTKDLWKGRAIATLIAARGININQQDHQVALAIKAKHRETLHHSHSTPEHVCPLKDMYVNIWGSFFLITNVHWQ